MGYNPEQMYGLHGHGSVRTGSFYVIDGPDGNPVKVHLPKPGKNRRSRTLAAPQGVALSATRDGEVHYETLANPKAAFERQNVLLQQGWLVWTDTKPVPKSHKPVFKGR